ncbi:multidrug transporter [Kribbella deserti]|uniref:Multidrug transporter n=1 Tax=Kribbella deserti TaxID=1926257 RepID=A0ABV6QKC0_9ACTN
MRSTTPLVLRRLRMLAVLEFVNIPLLSYVFIAVLGMPVTAANLIGLVLVAVILAEGGTYWWLKVRQLSAATPLPAGMRAYRVLLKANLALLVAGAIALGVLTGSGPAAGFWPGIALWFFAVLEHINYFHFQLMHDNRNDLARLVRTRRLHRSHLARDLGRAMVTSVR